MNKIKELYEELLKKHGYQGWWPINNSYTPKDYSAPRDEKERYEIILGTILTQNTTWGNAEKALNSLRKNHLVKPERILSLNEKELAKTIRSAGYYNQKAKYAKEITKLYLELKGRIPTRQELLRVKGVGKETADSILLYAYKQPVFVIDKYTKKFLHREKIITGNEKYEEIQRIFQEKLRKSYKKFNEYHALIVAEMKK